MMLGFLILLGVATRMKDEPSKPRGPLRANQPKVVAETATSDLSAVTAAPVLTPALGTGGPNAISTFHDATVCLRAVEEMLRCAGRFDQEQRRAKIANKVTEDPTAADLFAVALVDHEAGTRLFGDRLAEARYMARYIAKASARRGDDRWVVDVLHQLGSRVAKSTSVGERADFEDLLTALVEGLGLETFASRRDEILGALGYRAGDPPSPLRSAVRASIRTAAWRLGDLEVADDYVTRVL